MTDHLIQAARDAIELEGEVVTYSDTPDINKDIWVNIQYDADVFDQDGMPLIRITTLRGVKEDLQALTDQAQFTLANGTVYQKKKILKDDNITVAMHIGKKSSV